MANNEIKTVEDLLKEIESSNEGIGVDGKAKKRRINNGSY